VNTLNPRLREIVYGLQPGFICTFHLAGGGMVNGVFAAIDAGNNVVVLNGHGRMHRPNRMAELIAIDITQVVAVSWMPPWEDAKE